MTAPVLAPDATARVRAARDHAKTVFPGPVGDHRCRELTVWLEWAYRFDAAGRAVAMATDIEARHKAMVLGRTYG